MPHFNSNGRPAMLAVDSIKATLDSAGPVGREELQRRLKAGEQLYKQDCTIFTRNCEKEIVEPIGGTTTG